jgi:hypothetical protein
MAEHQVIDMVFKTRYGGASGEPPRLPTIEGELTRRPGTVTGYRRVKSKLLKARPDCDSRKACIHVEVDFELKCEQRRFWDISVHPETGERQESVRPALIAKRASESLMPKGTATRQWLYRALRAEAELYKRRGVYWERMELIWQKARFEPKKKKR